MLAEDSSLSQEQACGFDRVGVVWSANRGIRQRVAQRQGWGFLARGHLVQSTAGGKQSFVGYEGSHSKMG